RQAPSPGTLQDRSLFLPLKVVTEATANRLSPLREDVAGQPGHQSMMSQYRYPANLPLDLSMRQHGKVPEPDQRIRSQSASREILVRSGQQIVEARYF